MPSFFLADDLSGALDAGGAFHAAGHPVEIVVNAAGVGRGLARAAEAGPASAPLIAVTTETRNMPATYAAAVVEKVLTAARESKATLVYKKIDSTLRGPVAAELRAVLEAFPDARVLFAPANPAVGRTVENGILLVKGVPLAETEFARDPVNPTRSSALEEILADVADERLTIPDVRTEADLAAAVQRMNADGRPWIAVGSGALAKFVQLAGTAAARPPAAGDKAPPDQAVPPCTKHPVLMIAGSAHPANTAQIAQLQAARGGEVCEIDFNAPTDIAAAVAAVLDRCSLAVVKLPSERVDPVTALRAVARAVHAVLKTSAVTRVFATGGETAYALCNALAIERLEYLEELEPGVALAAGESLRGRMLLAVKPGGFGDAQTWVRVYDRLSR